MPWADELRYTGRDNAWHSVHELLESWLIVPAWPTRLAVVTTSVNRLEGPVTLDAATGTKLVTRVWRYAGKDLSLHMCRYTTMSLVVQQQMKSNKHHSTHSCAEVVPAGRDPANPRPGTNSHEHQWRPAIPEGTTRFYHQEHMQHATIQFDRKLTDVQYQ